MIRPKTGKSIAGFFSFIFHPLLMATFAAVIFFNSGHFFAVVNYELRTSVFLIFFILTCLTPALFVPAINFFRLSSNKEISDKNIRLITLFMISVLYAVVYYYMKRIMIPDVLLNIILSSILIMLAGGIISIFWNISLYTCAIGGLAGYVFFLAYAAGLTAVLFYFLIIVIVVGIVATSRLYLNKHNPLQVYTGIALGFFISYFTLLVF
ncbi:MAG: hypothetical protein LBQ22_06745 [Bacteroidales bacterium]|jgi:hypothetical protein|nr:hypothetical protein [Bacteroidales bacterium]